MVYLVKPQDTDETSEAAGEVLFSDSTSYLSDSLCSQPYIRARCKYYGEPHEH